MKRNNPPQKKPGKKHMENPSEIIFKTGIFGEKNFKIFDMISGQLSDGKWENTPGMDKYWETNEFIYNPDTKEVELKMRDYISYRSTRWNNRTHHMDEGATHYMHNPFMYKGNYKI